MKVKYEKLKWKEIGNDSDVIIAHSGQDLFVEFKPDGNGYQYYNVPFGIFERILNKECINKEGKPSYGATLNQLVLSADYPFEQYK